MKINELIGDNITDFFVINILANKGIYLLSVESRIIVIFNKIPVDFPVSQYKPDSLFWLMLSL